MTQVFTENEDNDLFVGDNKQLGLLSGIQSTVQITKAAMELQLGEAIYSIALGIPTDRAVWSGNPDLQQFESFARSQIERISDVVEVKEFNALINDDVLEYTATISTIYGDTTVNGSL